MELILSEENQPPPKQVYCSCEDWPVQSKIIDGYISLQAIRSNQHDLYKKQGGKPFVYCPFCSYKINKE